MPIGEKITIRVHENKQGALVLDTVDIKSITYTDGAMSTDPVVKKEDFTGTPYDAYTVQLSTTEGSPFSKTQNLNQILQVAKTAITDKFGPDEIGPAS